MNIIVLQSSAWYLYARLRQKRLLVGDVELRVEQTGIAPVELGALDETFSNIRSVGRKPPDQKRPLQAVEVVK